MLIYIFAEHYPNPYKPQFDTEFAYLIRQGHELKIFVGGQFNSIVHPRVQAYNLDKMTYLFPTTLRTLPPHIPKILYKLTRFPLTNFKKILSIYDRKSTLKSNILRISRMLLLPNTPPDLCYIHNIVTANYIDFLHLIFPRSRLVMYFHGGEVGGIPRTERACQLFNMMQLVFTNTQFCRAQAIERGSVPERTIVLPVGFDLNDYPTDSHKIYRKDGILRLISVGRLSEEKGLTYAIDAIAYLVANHFHNIRYVIVGRGIQEQFLKDYALGKGVEKYVEFVGEQNKPGVVSLMEKSDVLILPSIVTNTWAETQGAVIQEAMFMQLLVIATTTGGIPESTAPVMRPFAVPPRDSIAIANSIQMINSLTDQEFRKFGLSARKFAVERYDVEKIGEEFLRHVLKN